MKSENKIYRIVFLLIGLIIYTLFFITDSINDWPYIELDFRYSFVGNLIHKVLLKYVGWLWIKYFDPLRFFLILFFNAFYLYSLWHLREEVVVFIKKIFNKI